MLDLKKNDKFTILIRIYLNRLGNCLCLFYRKVENKEILVNLRLMQMNDIFKKNYLRLDIQRTAFLDKWPR